MSTSAMSARARPFLNGASRGAPRARVARPLAPAAAALKIGRVGGAVTPRAAIADPPGPVRGDAEKRAEEALLAGDDGDGTIAGFTKLEWSCIQTPARYLGNEIGAMYKDWDSAEVRFTMCSSRSTRWAPVTSATSSCTPSSTRLRVFCDRSYLRRGHGGLMKSKGRTLAVESKRPSRTLTRRISPRTSSAPSTSSR